MFYPIVIIYCTLAGQPSDRSSEAVGLYNTPDTLIKIIANKAEPKPRINELCIYYILTGNTTGRDCFSAYTW